MRRCVCGRPRTLSGRSSQCAVCRQGTGKAQDREKLTRAQWAARVRRQRERLARVA